MCGRCWPQLDDRRLPSRRRARGLVPHGLHPCQLVGSLLGDFRPDMTPRPSRTLRGRRLTFTVSETQRSELHTQARPADAPPSRRHDHLRVMLAHIPEQGRVLRTLREVLENGSEAAWLLAHAQRVPGSGANGPKKTRARAEGERRGSGGGAEDQRRGNGGPAEGERRAKSRPPYTNAPLVTATLRPERL